MLSHFTLILFLVASASATFLPLTRDVANHARNRGHLTFLEEYMSGNIDNFAKGAVTFYSDIPFLWVNPVVHERAHQMTDTGAYKWVAAFEQ